MIDIIIMHKFWHKSEALTPLPTKKTYFPFNKLEYKCHENRGYIWIVTTSTMLTYYRHSVFTKWICGMFQFLKQLLGSGKTMDH